MNRTYAIEMQNSLVMQVIFGILGLSVASQINIPLQPVPINLGTVAVMLIGLQYSCAAAIYSTISYIFLGIIGVPIFNHFCSGIPYFVGPTGGYLTGYICAAGVMSFVRERYFTENSIIDMVLLCAIGQFCIYILGISWLSYLKDLEFAIRVGFLPFIIPGIGKTMILASVMKIMKR